MSSSFRSSNSPRKPQEWSSWHASKNYTLEVAQHPERARMCGFGDKDRRPLAPAAIAKLVVLDHNQVVVPAEFIQTAFFVVVVDLWSEDGTDETNLVRIPAQNGASSKRYRVPKANARAMWPHTVPPGQGQHASSQFWSPAAGNASQQQSTVHASHVRTNSNGNTNHRAPSLETSATSPNTFRSPTLPMFSQASQPIEEVPTQPFFSINSSGSYSVTTFPQLLPYSYYIPPITPMQESGLSTPTAGPSASEGPSGEEVASEYARTLIGPLAANAQRLLDDKKQEGIFFLFQDLSVRTEGKFRLRMRLINVGAEPAPDPGASQVHCQRSDVLAQVFTDPFEVWSAKRFPGVPAATPLSKALLQQGLKIPGRSKTSSKPSSKRKKTKSQSIGTDTDAESSDEG